MAGLFLILSIGVVLLSQCFHCQYILIQNNKTWDEAEAFCRENHLHLATVHNDTDWEIFREELSANNFTSDVWMGLYNDIKSWRWSFQNENVTFNKWHPTEPNNNRGHEECVSFYKYSNGGNWNDFSCFSALSCVCYDGNRRQIVRLEIKTFSNTENDTQIQSIILQQIQEKLWYLGMAGNTKMAWIVQADGQVLHKRGH